MSSAWLRRLALAGLLLAAALMLAPAQAVARPSHVALVIGNSNYDAAGLLPNPVNDAEDMSVALTEIGYDVTTVFDADYEAMRTALARFAGKARGAEIAIVYFAGHGIEIDKHNYLIPTDAVLNADTDVPLLTIPLDLMLTAVAGASRLRVVLLDACRNNPFLQRMRSAGTARRSVLGRGLAAVETETGTLVSFAAKEGTTASDGEGRNSPYTKSLLSFVRQPGLDAGRMFRKVRDMVLKETGNQQEPFVSSSLPGDDVYLHPASPAPADETAQGPTAAPAVPPVDDEARLAWDAIKNSTDAGDYQTYLNHYGDSVYAKFARDRMARLSSRPVEPPPAEGGAAETVRVDPNVFSPPQERWYLATYDNLDLFGGDLHERGLPAATIGDCADQCGNNLACRAFTYNASARRCFLKSGFQFAQVFQGAVTGFFFRSTQPGNAPAFEADWEVFDRGDITGIDLGDSRAGSFDACRLSCDRSSGCNGFAYVYFTRAKQCWLKTGDVSGPVRNANALKGITSARRVSQTVRPASVVESFARN
ncbi:MAG: hypothetical protein BroJett030_09710 [Alphaproteobacteria bacterium]|nr:MAG: hypothetical protein BroJett030_09710 [Alphaproteobacteria bacterium]